MLDQPSSGTSAADLADAGDAAAATAVWDSRAAVNSMLAMRGTAAYQAGERGCSVRNYAFNCHVDVMSVGRWASR
jgi:hypothetical protein